MLHMDTHLTFGSVLRYWTTSVNVEQSVYVLIQSLKIY